MNTARPCSVCGKPVADGFLCWDDTHRLRDWLLEFSWLWSELEVVLSKQTRFVTSSPKVSASSSPALVIDTAAADVMVRFESTFRFWDAALGDRMGSPVRHPRVRAAAGFVLGALDVARTHPDIASLWFDIQDHRRHALTLVDRPAERIYLGECAATGTDETTDVDWRCDAILWGRAGTEVTTCRVCGTDHLTELRQTEIRERAVTGLEDRLMPALQAAETIVAYQLASEPNLTAVALAERIRKWATPRAGRPARLNVRMTLPPRPGQRSRPAYRFGDVLQVLHDTEQARTSRKAGAA